MSSTIVRPRQGVIGCLSAALFACACFVSHAGALVNGTTDTAAFADFSSPYRGMNLGGVVSWNGSSAVAVGSRYLLTADHVGGSVGSQITLHGVTYTATAVARAPADPDSSLPVDLRLITLDRDLPTYYNIRSAPITSNTAVVSAGYGYTGTDHGSYYTVNSTGRGTLRWGTNQVYYPATRQMVSGHSSVTFSMKFNSANSPLEFGFTPGDSGGASFIQAEDGSWELAGINAYVSSYNGNPDQFNQSYAVSLAPHLDWINSLISVQSVPEPASIALLAGIAAPLISRRRGHR
ncbi:MAG: trypsin-like serine protease [Phycisphaerales bacterium]